MIVWWSIEAGVHIEPHSHAQIVWMLKGKMEFRVGTEQRICKRCRRAGCRCETSRMRLKDATGRLLLSKTAVSQLGERLWEDYQFATRDLSEYEVTYLFVEGIAERLRAW
jgi:hypothetical protein